MITFFLGQSYGIFANFENEYEMTFP